MPLPPSEIAWLQKRQKLIAKWPVMLGLCAVLLFGYAGYLFAKVPLLINPGAAAERIRNNELEPGTIATMAVMVPTLFLVLLFVLATFLIFAHVFARNERRYQRIIDKLQDNQRTS